MRTIAVNFLGGVKRYYCEIKRVSFCTQEPGFCLALDEEIKIGDRICTSLDVSVISGHAMLGNRGMTDMLSVDKADLAYLLA